MPYIYGRVYNAENIKPSYFIFYSTNNPLKTIDIYYTFSKFVQTKVYKNDGYNTKNQIHSGRNAGERDNGLRYSLF